MDIIKFAYNAIITIYACIAEDFETVKQIYYENCLKSRELHQCKDRQFYTMILNMLLKTVQ